MFTLEEVQTALKEIVATKEPGYTYERVNSGNDCAYSTVKGEPSCLIGHLFAKLEPEFFKQIAWTEWETDEFDQPYVNGMTVAGSGIGSLSYSKLAERYEDAALNLMVDVQCGQDSGKAWDTLC